MTRVISHSSHGIAPITLTIDSKPVNAARSIISPTGNDNNSAKLAIQLPIRDVNRRVHSANFATSASPSKKPLRLYQIMTKTLKGWVASPPSFSANFVNSALFDEIMSRKKAEKVILSVFKNDTPELSLKGFRLTSLPDCLQHLYHLKHLHVDDNALSSLPALPKSLKGLNASHNQLSTLPVLPETLRELNVSWNVLKTLPALPKGLQTLKVDNTNLQALPALPEGLQTLHAGRVCLHTLPKLPASLSPVWIDNTLLEAEVDRVKSKSYPLTQAI